MASETATSNHLLKVGTITPKNVGDGSVDVDTALENSCAAVDDEEEDTKPAETPKFKVFISEDVVSGCWYLNG